MKIRFEDKKMLEDVCNATALCNYLNSSETFETKQSSDTTMAIGRD